MSRSFRHTPIFQNHGGYHLRSDKAYKVAEHRAERRHVRVALSVGALLPHRASYGSPNWSPKGGRHHWADHDAASLRK